MSDAPKDTPAAANGSLAGKVAVVTGATSGIGFAVVQQLLREGATVYLAVRSESKCTAALARLEQEGLIGPDKTARAFFHELTLDDPRDAKASAEKFLAREKRLDLLINNASLLLAKYKMGPVGVQEMLTVNHLSPFVFTLTLLPLLRSTAALPGTDVRIITVSSQSHKEIKPGMLPNGFKTRDSLNGPDSKEALEKDGDSFAAQNRRYGLSKLANILFTRILGERLEAERERERGEESGRGILALSIHPGTIATEGNYRAVSELSWPLSLVGYAIVRFTFSPVAQGGKHVFDAATSPVFRSASAEGEGGKEVYQGAYLIPRSSWKSWFSGGPKVSVERGPQSKLAADEAIAHELWSLTESVLKEEGINVGL